MLAIRYRLGADAKTSDDADDDHLDDKHKICGLFCAETIRGRSGLARVWLGLRPSVYDRSSRDFDPAAGFLYIRPEACWV